MNLPPLPLVDGRLLIDNSFIEALTTCPRKLQYDRLLKRRPTLEKPSLTFGTAIHLALEWRYKNCKNEPMTVLDEQTLIEEVLTPFFTNNPQPDGDHRTLQFAIEIVKHYNQRYMVEPFKLVTDKDQKVMTELSFCLPLFEFDPEQLFNNSKDFKVLANNKIPIYYVGRIDLPVIWDEQVIIVDHKTSGMLGNFYFDGQKVAPQYEGYCWGFEQLTGLPVSGFCINAIRTKDMPAKPRSSWDMWWDEGFQRHKEYLRPGQLDEWKKNTIKLIEEFFWHYQNDFMPQKKKACTLYGKCAYYDVCYLPEPNREQVLNSDQFEENNWTPLKK